MGRWVPVDPFPKPFHELSLEVSISYTFGTRCFPANHSISVTSTPEVQFGKCAPAPSRPNTQPQPVLSVLAHAKERARTKTATPSLCFALIPLIAFNVKVSCIFLYISRRSHVTLQQDLTRGWLDPTRQLFAIATRCEETAAEGVAHPLNIHTHIPIYI